MKKSLFVLVTVVLAAILCLDFGPLFTTRSKEINLLPNGNLNSVTYDSETDSYLLNDWTISQYFGVRERGEGDYCVKTSSKTEDNILITANALTLNAGEYKVKFSAKVSGSCDVVASLFNGVREVECANEHVDQSDDYAPYSCDSFSLATGGDYYFRLIVRNNTSKQVFIDDLELIKVSNDEIKTESSAGIRADAVSPGLRFKGKVDKSLFDAYTAAYSDVKAGMIIAPTDYLDDCDFTFEALSAAKAVVVCLADTWNNSDTISVDGYYGFNCALVNFRPYNIDRKFSARSFIRYVDGGVTKYVYGDYDEENNARSVYEVALNAREHLDQYADYQIETINYFCNMIERPVATNKSRSGNTFTLEFSDIKGYFALDYDEDLYSVSVTSFTVGGVAEDFSDGVYNVTAKSSVSITFTVFASGEIEGYPVSGKVYKAD